MPPDISKGSAEPPSALYSGRWAIPKQEKVRVKQYQALQQAEVWVCLDTACQPELKKNPLWNHI